MIHILQVTGSLRVGGLETVAMNCVRYADSNKYRFDFLVFGDQIGENEEEAKRKGCRIIHISSPQGNYFEYYHNLCKTIKDNGPYDIVHSHVFFNSGIVMLAAKRCGVPVRIAHAHSVKRKSDEGIKKAVFHCLMRYLLISNTTKFCACSEQAGKYVFTARVFEKRGIVIPNAINVNAYLFSCKDRKKIRDELNIEKNCTVIGQVGHLTSAKNQLFLLEVFAEYVKKHPNAVLLIVGEGEMRTQIEEKIKNMGLGNHIRLTGTRTDIGALLSATDIYVCTSTNEGFGLTLLEAAANGLQVIIEKNVLVDELKPFICYHDIDGFDINAWNAKINSALKYGRNFEHVESIKSSPYSTKGLSSLIEKIYGVSS